VEGRRFAGARPSVYSCPVRVHGAGSEHRVEHVFYFTTCFADSPSHERGTWTGDIASPGWGIAWVMVALWWAASAPLCDEFGDINIRWGQACPLRLAEAIHLISSATIW
jgi:hypothetical protein